MRETWYVLEDEEVVDPADVSTRDDGRLIHSSGVMVAMRGNVPHSRGVDDPEAARAAAAQERDIANAAKKADAASGVADSEKTPDEARADVGLPPIPSTEPPKATREMAADKPKRGYKTRGAKAG